MCVNVRRISVGVLVGLAGWCPSALADSDCENSAAFTIDNRGGCGIIGVLVLVNAQGQIVGPLSGATVAVSGAGSTTTNAQGQYAFSGLQPSMVTMTVSKSGFYTVTRQVNLAAGETKNETFQLTALSGGATPAAFDFSSQNGQHLIEGMPGDITFAVNVAWNGTPGSAYFTVAGTQYAATITDLGGGLARATLTLPAPSLIDMCSELTIEVVNGAGQRTYVNTGVHFYPIPGIIVPWYRDNIPWTPSGLTLSYSNEVSVNWELPLLGGGGPELKVFLGSQQELSYDLLGGVFSGSVGGFGGFGLDWEISQVEILGEGQYDLSGNLDISLAGCGAPTITPGWEASFTGKAGLGAPVVLIVDVIFPPAAPAVDFLLSLPVVGEVVGALKLRVYLIGGAGLSGEYEGGQWGECFLGTTSLSVSGTLGIEGEIAVELLGAEAGIYAGGTGTPELQICPDLQFECLTLRAYVGVFAHVWLFQFQSEVGAEVAFGSCGRRGVVTGPPHGGGWKPIGSGMLRWGEANRLVAIGGPRGPGEETLVENVTQLGAPSVVADATETHVVYSLHDPNKPWYEATDVGSLRCVNGGPWSQERVADDEVADFVPRIAPAGTAIELTAWEQVDGDISGATDPGQIAPYLEIAGSWFDRATGQWSVPVLLVDNDVVDRNPLPAVFGARQGVIWVQNEADASPGNATHGDRLMFAEWSESSWTEPQTLWSAPKGVLGLAFAADATGEGHAVFAVDEDGDLETRTDRELYSVATSAGDWQTATRLTIDVVEDALPVLVMPNSEVTCVWSAGGTLHYTPLAAWNPQVVYSEYTVANEAPSLAGVTMPAGAAVAYTVQGESGVDIVAAFYDANLDKWSLPRQLTHDEHVETALSLAYDGSELVIAYLKTQTARNAVDVEIDGVIHHLENVPQPARTDLCLLRYALGHDLAVRAGSIVLEPANPAPATSATIGATIENRGDLVVQGVQVAFYDGDPDDGGTVIGTVQTVPGLLIAGATYEVTATWAVSEFPECHTVFVVVDPTLAFDDRDRANNVASKLTVLPDVAIETGWSNQVSCTSVALAARTINAGALPSGAFELSWRLGAADGPEIGMSNVGSIISGGASEISFVWNTAGMTPGEYVQVFAIADASNAVVEFNEGNNVASQAAMIPLRPIAGDLNADSSVSFADIDLFIAVLLGLDADPCRMAVADVNNSGAADGQDIQPLVDLLLAP